MGTWCPPFGIVHTALLGEQAFQAHHFVSKLSDNLGEVVEGKN